MNSPETVSPEAMAVNNNVPVKNEGSEFYYAASFIVAHESGTDNWTVLMEFNKHKKNSVTIFQTLSVFFHAWVIINVFVGASVLKLLPC